MEGIEREVEEVYGGVLSDSTIAWMSSSAGKFPEVAKAKKLVVEKEKKKSKSKATRARSRSRSRSKK